MRDANVVVVASFQWKPTMIDDPLDLRYVEQTEDGSVKKVKNANDKNSMNSWTTLVHESPITW